MYNIVTRKDIDPTEAFSGIWVNEKSGSVFLWTDKAVLIGFSKDGKVVRADVFKADFTYEPERQKQKYKWEYEYHGLPMLVVADVTRSKFNGTDLSIRFGDEYGTVSNSGRFIVAQAGNVKLGENLTLECIPTNGSLHVDLIVLSYE